MTLLISVFAASDAKCFLYLDAVHPYIAERKWERDATITVPRGTNTAMNRGSATDSSYTNFDNSTSILPVDSLTSGRTLGLHRPRYQRPNSPTMENGI